MVKVLSQLKTLVIKCKDRLKEGQHLQTREADKNINHSCNKQPKEKVISINEYFPFQSLYDDFIVYCCACFASHSPAPHSQTFFSLGSPAACKRSPETPPESAASTFPPGRLPEEHTAR